MSGAPFLFVGYGLATVLYGGYFLRLFLRRRTLAAQLRAAGVE